MNKDLITSRDLRWKITFGVLSLILGALATRLAVYLTDTIWGEGESLPQPEV
jgi:hypothetical protein